MTGEGSSGHSAAFFGKQRDFWWNEDFLDLVVARLGLGAARTVLDVGCGLGHWSRALGGLLPDLTEITGVDPEPAWVERAQLLPDDRPDVKRSVVQGRAEDLPFADESFDLVTCQTVLIHVADVDVVLREMSRVTRPGGTVLVAEPNNLAGHLVRTKMPGQSGPESLTSAVAFYATCEAGKSSLGEGDSSVGDLLPGHFAEAGLSLVGCYLSDKASPLWPPYSSPEQSALVQAIASAVAEERCPWNREETLRYFVAGGGKEAEFPEAWSARMSELRAEFTALRSGELSTAGGQLMYLIAGRKTQEATRAGAEMPESVAHSSRKEEQ